MRQERQAKLTVPAIILMLLPLLLLWPTMRHIIESRMSMHMLGEFPALFVAGWSASRLCLRRAQAREAVGAFALLDWRGWTGATLTSCVAIVWMVPSALDAALLSGDVAAAKYASWWFAGWMLAGSWRRIDHEVMLFFVGNLAWMTASAGMLYIDAPAQLCVNYLQDDQRRAGIGLILLALGLGIVAIRQAIRPAGPGRAAAPPARIASSSPP